MSQTLETLFHSELLTIRHVRVRPTATECGDIEREAADLLVMPIAGLFAKHDGPGKKLIANSNHALFFGNDKPYRVSFPGGIGDVCIILEFSKAALAGMLSEVAGIENLHSPLIETHCLNSPATILNRGLLCRQLALGKANPLAIEEISVTLLTASIRGACKDSRRADRARHSVTRPRRQLQVESVKEAISLHPDQAWSLSDLANLVNVSPCHLAHVFREEVGIPVHKYLIHTRLGRALEAVNILDEDLTKIALDMGFASHSHFTSSFRSLFGITPTQLRREMEF